MSTIAGATPSSPSGGEPPKIPTPKPPPEDFEEPVAWLLGRQLIANLKWILLYTAFKGKLDPRDWMDATIIPPRRTQAAIDAYWRRWNQHWKEEEDGQLESSKEFWFDYMSDTGDGQRAVYSIAYLCMSDFAVKKDAQPGDKLQFILEPNQSKLEAEGRQFLPRGTFLFVGGDTSYHISDYSTLSTRFQNPFCWAFADLYGKSQSVMGKVRRLLVGIPGNHDYYDSLDGFNRQFRRPSTGDHVSDEGRTPLLAIPGFRRQQEASYLAMRLPFDWWFWGLDTEQGEIDFRQLEFFNDIRTKYEVKKLIVATPEPTTVFGKYATEKESQSKTFAALGLERAFLRMPEPLGEGKCRLDLAGDVHHYARYWGPEKASSSPTNYASVMSGGGGAFYHPSHTDIKEVEPKVIYPLHEPSREKVADRIFNFNNIRKGGYVHIIGFLIAFAITFATIFPQSTRDAVDSFRPWIELGISQGLTMPTQTQFAGMPRETPWSEAPWAFFWGILALVASIGTLGGTLYYSYNYVFKKEYDPTWSEPKAVTSGQLYRLLAMITLSFGMLTAGILIFYNTVKFLTPFGRSLIIMAALVWAVMAIVESLWYAEWLFAEAYKRNTKWWEDIPLWGLPALPVLAFGVSLWLFGKHQSALLISDLGLMIILLFAFIGLPYFAYSSGGHLAKGIGSWGFVLLGLSHGLLQVAVPFLLIRRGHLLWAPLATLALVIVFKYLGNRLAKMENGWPLALAWIAFGALLLLIPYIPYLTRPLGLPTDPWLQPLLSSDFLGVAGARWLQLLLCIYAGLIGAVMSCVLFAWYLAVSLAFNGHNNEAGGAARYEGFKQFIRFRVNREGLTGYVIAIDEPNTEGGQGKLDPTIIDVFHLRP